jgi:hypothetical protein
VFEKDYPMSQSSTARPTCPSCKKRNCKRNYSECSSVSASIPHTLGTRADKNTDKMSEDEKHHITRENTKYLHERPSNPLPEGMSRIPRDESGKVIISDKKNRKPKKRKVVDD